MVEPTSPDQVRANFANVVGAEIDSLFTGNAPAIMPETSVNISGPTPAPVPAPVAPQPVSPPSPPVAPAPAAPTAQPAPTPSAPAPGTTPAGRPEYAGKYHSKEEFEKGYYHLLNILTDTQAKLQAREETPASVQPNTPPRANPVERGNRRAEVLGQFQEEYGVEPEKLASVVDVLVEEAINNKITPMQEVQKAEVKFLEEFPDAQGKSREIAATINADPTVARVVALAWQGGDYVGAMRYAWAMTSLQMNQATERAGMANAYVAQEELIAARSAAGLISSQNTGVHEEPAPEMTNEQYQSLVERYQAGDKAPLLRQTLGKTLPDELFDPRYFAQA